MLNSPESGRELHRRIRVAISETITRVYSDISAADLATAGRVLSAITERANAELAGAQNERTSDETPRGAEGDVT